MLIGQQNLVYYGGHNNIINSPNEMHINPSHSNIPVLQGSGGGLKGSSQVVTVPQTQLHKSNKIMNSYLKQGTVQQNPLEQQMFGKRLSTDQMMHDKDQMSMSIKKQGFHQRAETQLKNPQSNLLMGVSPQYENQKELMGGSSSNQFLVQPHQMGNTQIQFGSGKQYSIVLNPNQKFNNSKSQKSSTSRLINNGGS